MLMEVNNMYMVIAMVVIKVLGDLLKKEVD